jgi:hypothetical protein
VFSVETGALTFAGDGTCRLESTKSGGRGTGWFAERRTAPSPVCTWRLGTAQVRVWHLDRGVPVVALELDQEAGTHSRIEFVSLYVYEEGTTLILWDWADDPDYPNYVSLKKEIAGP